MLHDVIRETPLDGLAHRMRKLRTRIDSLKLELAQEMQPLLDEKAAIEDELYNRYSTLVEHELEKKAEPAGNVTVSLNGHVLHAHVGKKVTWDQSVLRDFIRHLDEEGIQKYFGENLKVGERAYKTCDDDGLIDMLEKARFVEYQTPTFDVIPKGDEGDDAVTGDFDTSVGAFREPKRNSVLRAV